MWSDSDGERELKPNEVGPGRNSTGSEVVVMDERAMTAAADNLPNVAQLNVSHKSKVHLGPKFVSVTQNVHNAEMVKNLPLPCYLWKIIKSTSRAERVWCLAGLAIIVVCLVLIIYYTKGAEPAEDIAPHEWNITRAMWLAKKYETVEDTQDFEPLRLVVIQHSVSQECRLFVNCAAEMRNLQAGNIRECRCDIAYNFLIGNDGRVYEGRGWGKVGAHTLSYNRCALGVGFIGDYREEMPSHSSVSKSQINRTMILLQYGVKSGYLHPNYRVVGAKDLQNTVSPGSNLYNAIRKWEHYNTTATYRHKSCEEIYEELANNEPKVSKERGNSTLFLART